MLNKIVKCYMFNDDWSRKWTNIKANSSQKITRASKSDYKGVKTFSLYV